MSILATKTMKAMAIDKFGGLKNIKEMELPLADPLPNEVQIHVAFSGVNPIDWKIMEGLKQERYRHEFPLILGCEGSGVVSRVGTGVSHLKTGDAVFAFTRSNIVKNGTWAEFICFDARHVALKPTTLDFAQAAAIPLNALTAWQVLLEVAELKKGETILIHAGAGGVGGMAIQIARFLGAHVITTARANNHPYVKRLGAHLAIDYTKENVAAVLKRHFPGGVHVVFDTIGKDVQQQSFAYLEPQGKLISIVEPPDPKLAKKNAVIASYYVTHPDGSQLREVTRLFERGIFHAPPLETFSLNKAADALKKVKEGHTHGKVILEVSPHKH